MPVLDAKNLRKSLGNRVLLDQVDVTIRRREKIGVVGDNGAGKSTLARILGGTLEADLGVINRRKGARIEYLEQAPDLPAGQTAREIALSGLQEWLAAKRAYDAVCERLAQAEDNLELLLEEQARLTHELENLGGFQRVTEAERILTMLGIERFDQDVATMSGGERRRVALARLLITAPDLAILDEPTNHLDASTVEWLESYLLERFEGALLLITHDRFLLNNLVSRTWEVVDGQVYSYEGGWEEFLMGRAERLDHQNRTEQNRQNFLRKELEWLRRQPKARTGKQKARIARAETALSVEPVRTTAALSLELAEQRLGGTILEARELSVSIAGRSLVRDLTLHLSRGSRVGILGKSGAGKTTLLKTLLGEHPPAAGKVIRGKNTRIAYLDQMRGGLDEDATVFDAITHGHPSVTIGDESYTSYSYLERFRFRGDAIRQKVAGLSGGEKARVALARLLLEPANVLVLDEPTNDLDVMTLASLEELLLQMKGAALIVSHDRYFLDRVATSVLALDGEGGIVEIQGGYSSYREYQRAKESENKAEQERAHARTSSPPASAKPRGLTYAEQKEFANLLERVEHAQAEVTRLEAELADPSLYTERREEVESLQAELQKAREQAEQLEERWFLLEEKRTAALS